MLKTKDGQCYRIGMWVSDSSGIYCVTEINDSELPVVAREVIFDDDEDDSCTDFTLGDERYWTVSDANSKSYE